MRLQKANWSVRFGQSGHYPEFRQAISDHTTKSAAARPVANAFSRARRGFRTDIGIHVRSAWEANYARYLNLLIRAGSIAKWEYEPITFWFEAIKRGCRSWKPDFRVTLPDGGIEYHEVKGWMYPRAKTALRRMRKYHPAVVIVLIDQDRYKAIAKTVSKLLRGWE